MKKNVEISCIMPVHNSGKYLKKTLKSLVKQTFSDMEIICVNDASEDESLKILEDLCRQESKISIFNNREKKGAAVSRNIGLENANGKYVIFLDSDDYFYENMLEQAYKMAEEYQASAVFFGYERVRIKNDDETAMVVEDCVQDFQVVQKGQRSEEYIWMIGHTAWNKLIKKDVLCRYGIKFQDIASNNDIFFSMAVGLAVERVVICDNILMRYYFGRNGSITQFRRSRGNCQILAFEQLLAFLEKFKVEKALECELYNYIIDMLERQFDEEDNSLECLQSIEEQLYACTLFMQKLKKAYENGILYPHAEAFISKVFLKEEVKGCKYYEYYIPQLTKLLMKMKQLGQKLAIWGCGKIGKKIVNGMNENKLVFDYLIDMDEKKRNTTFGGYTIHKYEEVKDHVDVVLVTSRSYYEQVKKIAKGKTVLNLHHLS